MKSRAKWTATGGRQKRHGVRNTMLALLAFVVGFSVMLGALYWFNRPKPTHKFQQTFAMIHAANVRLGR